ncbi:MAG: N-acetylmuramoyl-L-alanine amidase-like domain-containing protein [Myxococcota bacterium]
MTSWLVSILLTGLPPADACARPRPPIAMRVEQLTRPLLGVPYLLSPLGEGLGRSPDPDPLARLDAFDCTTFVETALALADCGPESLGLRLARVRYSDGRIHFEDRRHFVASEWTPELIAQGVLQDVTQQLFPSSTKALAFDFSQRRWDERRLAQTLVLPAEALPLGRHKIHYVPVAALDPKRLEAGLVINVVKMDWAGAPDLVAHQALTIEKEGRLRFRHASTARSQVVDESPAWFMRRLAQPRAWPVLGLQLLRIVDQSD